MGIHRTLNPTGFGLSELGLYFMKQHYISCVIDFEQIGPYQLQVKFDDGVEQEIDFQPVLEGSMFGPLKDERLFSQVEVDLEVHMLVWPNGADGESRMV
jgi:hypothetical protein